MTFAHGEFRVFLEAYAKVRGVTVVHPRKPSQPRRAQAVALLEVGGVHTFTVSDAD
jgi:hypothetical protein